MTVVVNPLSTRFSPEEIRAALERVLAGRGLRLRLLDVPQTRDAERTVRRQVSRAIREGCTRIVAAGGDGTVAMVAQCIARRRGATAPISLGIIPAGTANVLARELGIPMALEASIEAVVEARQAIDLDAILVSRRYALTQVGIGPDALMIRDTSRERQAKLGRLAYALTFLRRAFGYRPRPFTLRIDGQTVRERAWQLVAANVGSIGAPPFTWGPRIDPTDGTLDLCVYNVRRKRDYGRLLWRVLAGRHRRDESTRFYRVRDRVVVESNQPVLVQGDGEIIGRTPVTLRVVPGAIRVLVARAVEGTVPPMSLAPEARGTEWDGSEGGRRPVRSDAAPAPDSSSTGEQIEQMIAQHSRTWALQGALRHPIAAFEALDAALFLRVNALTFGTLLDRTMWLLSHFINYGEGWAIVVFMMILADPRSGMRTAVEALPALWATMLTVNVVLKRVFRRRRPFIAFVKARVIGPRPRDFSFPSGHAAAGFAGAVLLGAHAPAWAPLFYLFAVLVSFSRIYLGVHYPSDVAIGALAGSILAVTYQALVHLLLRGMF